MKNTLNNASALRSAIRGIAVIAIAAVIGLSMTACKEEEGGDSFNGQTLISGVPSLATLKEYGISNSTINELINAARAADDDYKGYYEHTIDMGFMMKMKMLVFIWYNKTKTKYESVCDHLESELDLYWIQGDMSMGLSPIPSGTAEALNGSYIPDDDNLGDTFTCTVQFYLKDYNGVPKNALSVGFGTSSYSFFGF